MLYSKKNSMTPADNKTSLITVQGTVQGVGFRPFIFKLAADLQINGTVSNSEKGVLITTQASAPTVKSFISRIATEAPPVAAISAITVTEIQENVTYSDFTIISSVQQDKASVPITPDLAVCNQCIKEITTPTDRRYLYPFTNCTNCGPRFTIIEQVPYDRPFTSMRHFKMCDACDKEYNNPLDRRFHAQPNACPTCGPKLSWHDRFGTTLHSTDCLQNTVEALANGNIVAIKGLGGFHLATAASSFKAVATLRKRKNRPSKPLAIMVRDIEIAKKYCSISETEAQLLQSPQRPIVLLTKKTKLKLADNVAEGLQILGVMLAYTPLHYLLLNHKNAPEALVMTSGNSSNEPICINNQDALQRLRDLADFFLLHNRDIVTRVDDSVVRVMNNKPHLLRRARGYTPSPIVLTSPTDNILACGGEMKNTFCVVRNNEAYISQHIGELNTPEYLDFYTESIEHLQSALQFTPTSAAHDLHPDYLSTRYAQQLSITTKAIQHHHAHAGAVMAEHGITDTCLSIILDGTGYGEDRSIFGGEIYITDRTSFQRVGHLEQFQLPGGDKAAREPWRTALSLLHKHYGPASIATNLPLSLKKIAPAKISIITQMLDKNINSPLTSSCGRIFDGVSALLGICLVSLHEGHAAMLLESNASHILTNKKYMEHASERQYPISLKREDKKTVLQTSTLIENILTDLDQSIPTEIIAYRFHQWLINSIASASLSLLEKNKIDRVILSGGCMQNKILIEGLIIQLESQGINVYSGQAIPVNDGGLSLGQAYIGGATQVA